MKLKKYFLCAMMAIMALGFGGIAEAESKVSSLNNKQADIVTIAAFTAQGDLPNLKKALNTALDNGMTINEAKEVLIQMYAYCGFPRSLNGLNTLMAVIEQRQEWGITDSLGKDATAVDVNRDRYAIGEKTQTELVGRPVIGKIYDFAPTIGVFLKEHLFGDIFERDVLTHQERELATVGALAGLGNVNPQLASHMRVSMNVKITPQQLKDVVEVLKTRVSSDIGENANTVLNSVLVKN